MTKRLWDCTVEATVSANVVVEAEDEEEAVRLAEEMAEEALAAEGDYENIQVTEACESEFDGKITPPSIAEAHMGFQQATGLADEIIPQAYSDWQESSLDFVTWWNQHQGDYI